jgi:tungstate transport system substrate-binding protein
MGNARVAGILVLLGCVAAPRLGAAPERLLLATTTSTENSGLLGVLLPAFESTSGVRVDVLAVGTGAAFKLGENGDADVLLVHDRPAELTFVRDGYGVDRRDVMYNDFVLLGPDDDPARVREAATAVQAFGRIARQAGLFVSRGDDSGTHRKEREIWAATGITPAGPWYREAGQGMGAVLTMAAEKEAYTLADRGTYLAMMHRLALAVLLAGDPALFNPYGVIAVNPERNPHVNHTAARAFIRWLVSEEARRLITGFTVGGEQLFFVPPVP